MPPSKPHVRSHGTRWWLILLLVALIAGGLYWWQRESIDPIFQVGRPVPETGPEDMPETGSGAHDAAGGGASVGREAGFDGQEEAAQRAEGEAPDLADRPDRQDSSEATDLAEASDAPKYPLPAGVALEGDPSLPPLATSDEPILEALSSVVDRAELGRYGNIGDFTRRFVVTVDNLPRELVPAQYSAVQRIPGPLAIDDENGRVTLSTANYARYDAFTGFVEQLGAKTMVSLYLRFYPLLQQEYRAMGFPKGHFNDRVVEAIDDMLSAPKPDGPIVLVQPRVHYEFADPRLQRLSAGRKLMIRVGPDNAARLQKVLREIRAELVQ